MKDKLTLYGFNNLTKTLSFNIYDICYAKTAREQKDYIAYIDDSIIERLTSILVHVTEMIELLSSIFPNKITNPRVPRSMY